MTWAKRFHLFLQHFAIRYWIQNGAPKDKLNLGIATYGRSFTLENASNNGVGAPAKGAGKPGPYTREAGYLGYNEVQQFLYYMFYSFLHTNINTSVHYILSNTVSKCNSDILLLINMPSSFTSHYPASWKADKTVC